LCFVGSSFETFEGSLCSWGPFVEMSAICVLPPVRYLNSEIRSWSAEEAAYDQLQVKYMREEMCITVDQQDNIIGFGSKKECHLNENIDNGLLHRAFSVFLFNKDGKLLLQQRAKEKITFPEYWTNTVCSHPLSNLAFECDGVSGVKLAAVRKLKHELGMDVPLDCLRFVTRILYSARSDDRWGEHEIDYVLLAQCDDVALEPNPNEVAEHRFVGVEEARELVSQAERGLLRVTPWFRLIFDRFLFSWWSTLLSNGSLPSDSHIHRLH